MTLLSRPASATIPFLVESVASDASGFFTLSQFLLGPERNPKSFRSPLICSTKRKLSPGWQLRARTLISAVACDFLSVICSNYFWMGSNFSSFSFRRSSGCARRSSPLSFSKSNAYRNTWSSWASECPYRNLKFRLYRITLLAIHRDSRTRSNFLEQR